LDELRNIKLLLEYDGTAYVGWQRQDNGKSIQGEVESVLRQILQEDVNLIGAGRTDAGVHARGQVANFRTKSGIDLHQLKGGLNALLPMDIVAHSVDEVPFDFHARYSANEREYSYSIARAETALMRHYSWNVKYMLDLGLMERAASLVVGEHDFESFCKMNSEVDHYRCSVSIAEWREEQSWLYFTIRANRFLHGMVRALVGTMVDVGRGYISIGDFWDIIEKKDRSAAGMSAPAKGLVLERILY
jgi:tRNA pseudouridine38-40 synthase